jgi:UPF0271 protein
VSIESTAFEAFGDTAWRLRMPDGKGGAGLLATLKSFPGVIDAVVTERHAVVTFAPGAPPDGLADAVRAAVEASSLDDAAPREHVVRTRYDGEDLGAIAAAIGRTPRDVVGLHAGHRYTVAAIGFQPGFAYLRGLDAQLVVPRRPTPRPRVDARSVAIAGPYTGVYPFASPGGWHLVGHAVDFTPFDRERGARLSLGDHVTFVEVP